MCATFCSFCKKNTSKLVPHYLCDCCLVHLECCEATPENRWASLANTIIPKENPNEKIACEICLEKYPEDELEEHQELCTARLVFRCTVCDGDYVSKEGLWNHLDQHEISDESKDLYYQEIRATYKLHKCVLCNDQRGYQETIYWRHVHEDHDGFFLRCLDCGENFRSEKRKTDHAVSHCNAWKQIEQGQMCSRIVLFKLVNVDSQFSEQHPSADNYGGDVVENELKIEAGIPQISLKKTSTVSTDKKYTLVAHEEKSSDTSVVSEIRQDQCDETSIATFQIADDYKCTHCGKECHNEKNLRRHYINCHKPTECKLCKKKFIGTATYQYHRLIRHTDPRYKCPHCQLLFHQKIAYQRHSARCAPERCVNKDFEQKNLSLSGDNFGG